jgi:hypothetical protein
LVLADHYFFATIRQMSFAWSTRRRGEEDAVGIDEWEEREEGEKEIILAETLRLIGGRVRNRRLGFGWECVR